MAPSAPSTPPSVPVQPTVPQYISSPSEQMFDCHTQNVNLEWLCLKCGMPDINSTIFDSSISSEESSSEISTKIKAKMLRIMIVNFQGIWSKKEFFENCLLNSNADVVIGSETFLDPSIKNAEFLPPGFTAYRRIMRMAGEVS